MTTDIDRQVQKRFYEALDNLIERKIIRGIQTYCRLHNIDKRNLYAQRKRTDVTIMHFDWLLPMVTEYGISSYWLLTGIGEMYLPYYQKNTKNA
ncbi:MAG: hypothetical protein KBT28_05185 [Bacteroidales bacterium]|nr:hypothetical protein [Candidatus Colimorpha merdihippi]